MNDVVRSMACVKIVSIISILAALLLIGFGSGQDWLEGGFVRSGDYGDMRQYFMDPIFFSPGGSYASSGPFISPMGGNKNVVLLGSQAKWARWAEQAETADHAGTRFSFKTYPKSSYTSPSTQSPIAVAGDTPVTIVSQGMRGYQVFLNEKYIGTEGTSGDALDGKFSFDVTGNQYYGVRIYDGHLSYMKTIYFPSYVPKTIYVEQGVGLYI